MIDVEYEPLPAVLDAEAALAAGAPVLHEELGDNNFAHIEFEAGDVDGAFADAAHVFRKRFHFGRTPRGAARGPRRDRRLGRGRGRGDGLDVDADAVPRARHARGAVRAAGHARARDLPGRRRRLRPQGAAVRRGGRSSPSCRAAWARRSSGSRTATRRWPRAAHAKEVVCELALATDADGRFLALQGRYVGDGGAYLAHPWTSLIDPLCAASFLPGLYDVQNVRYEVDTPFTNKCQSTAYRGVGWTPGQAAREALIDDARARARHRSGRAAAAQHIPDGVPYRSATGCNYDGGSFAESIRRAAGADRLRRAARPAARAAHGGPLPRDRLQPVRRAGRLGRRDRRRQRLPGLQLPRRGQRRDGARRHRHAHDRPPVERPGARDDDGAGRRRRARGQARGRQGRPGRHRRHRRTRPGATAAAPR